MQTMPRMLIAIAAALIGCLAIALIGATAIAIAHDGTAIQATFDFYKAVATIISGGLTLVLGAMGVTHVVVNGSSSTAQPAPANPDGTAGLGA